MSTNESNLIVATYLTHSEAEAAVRELQKSGFDMKKLSIVGKGYHSEDTVVGYYNAGDRMMAWGKTGAIWGGVWGMLFWGGLFFIPGVGPVLLAGPLVSALVGALEGIAVIGGLSVLGAALFSAGIPKDSILQYETSISAGKFLLLAHASPLEIAATKVILEASNHQGVSVHGE